MVLGSTDYGAYDFVSAEQVNEKRGKENRKERVGSIEVKENAARPTFTRGAALSAALDPALALCF